MNNASSFYDASTERLSMPPLTTSLSFDSLVMPDESEGDHSEFILPGRSRGRSRGLSQELGEEGATSCSTHSKQKSPLPFHSSRDHQDTNHLDSATNVKEENKDKEEEEEQEKQEEIKQIRTANLLQRTLYMELQREQRGGVEHSEHPLLQGEVRSEDSELLVTGELKGKQHNLLSSSLSFAEGTGAGGSSSSSSSIVSIIASVMNEETPFDTWQEGFSLYLQKRMQKQVQQHESSSVLTTSTPSDSSSSGGPGAETGTIHISSSSGCSGAETSSKSSVTLEKKPAKHSFLFRDMDWTAVDRPPSQGLTEPAASTAGVNTATDITTAHASEPLFTINEVGTPTKTLGKNVFIVPPSSPSTDNLDKLDFGAQVPLPFSPLLSSLVLLC